MGPPKGVSKGESPKVVPPMRVHHGGSPMGGSTRGVSKGGGFEGGSQRGAPGVGFPEVVRRGVPLGRSPCSGLPGAAHMGFPSVVPH
jgi:hypothetical protein